MTIGIVLMGCEDFLDEVPVTTLNTANFFQSEKDFEQALNAAYSNLHSLSDSRTEFDGGYWSFSEMRSDNTTFMFNTSDRSGHLFWYMDTFVMDSQSDLVVNVWRESYAGIGKCNTVIEYGEGQTFESGNRIIAEAKFLRALYYAYLVRYFGNVPLVTKAAESYEEAFSGNMKVSKAEIYALIEADLEFAKNNLDYTTEEPGRATQGAARTLLAKELMWQGKYADAIPELEHVIANGPY